jgi:hypothetical protein
VRRALPLLVLLAGSLAVADALRPRATPARVAVTPEPEGSVRWIVAGGGSEPALNQIQLEQDLVLARQRLSPLGPGRVLFAGGPGSRAVQVLRGEEAPTLRQRLARILDPRSGRDGRYQAAAIAPDGPATRGGIVAAVREALAADPVAPLTVYLAGHGSGGRTTAEVIFRTWGSGDLRMGDLAALFDGPHRPTRVVVTSCYGGAFADLVFERGAPEAGAHEGELCGLFATTWDRVAAGCDPNPERGAQEGYGIHFLHALAGRDREGRPAEGIDLDGDGAVGLLEAHTRAQIASRSLDVPSTTSERWVRHAVEEDAPGDALLELPEERALLEGLTARTGAADAAEAAARWRAIDARVDAMAEEVRGLDGRIRDLEDDLRAALLHTYPALDDAWHPDFVETLDGHAGELERWLDEREELARLEALSRRRDDLADAHDDRLVEAAPYERMMRAAETMRRAAILRARGGPAWARFEALRACERATP